MLPPDNMSSPITDRNLPAQPEGTVLIERWTIYALIDAWISESRIKPAHQLFFFLLLTLCIAGAMVLITLPIAAFPSIPIFLFILIQAAIIVPTILLHELCHGIVILLYGGSPRYGYKWLNGLGPVVYATTEGFFPIIAYKHIASAPLIIVSGVCLILVLLGYGWWVIFPFIFNAVGSGGDLLGLRVLGKFRGSYFVEDTQDGFNIYRTSAPPN